MKKTILAIALVGLTALVLISILPSSTQAGPPVDSIIQDPYFYAEVLKIIEKPDGYAITPADVAGITTLFVNSSNIKSLAGIEYFAALEYLNCSGWFNQLTTLDVSNNTALEHLDCSGNQLTALDVSNNTALESLYCDRNLLRSIDVSNNTALTVLSCSQNQLTTLDVSKNTVLKNLDCSNNLLTTLDVSNNTELAWLGCSDNQLATLDVSNNPMLTGLYCHNNLLTALDVSKNAALTGLLCLRNQLTTLDVSNNTVLDYLECSLNPLMMIDVSNNAALTVLGCSENQLATLDVSNNTALIRLNCAVNQLATLDVSKNFALEELICFGNQLTTLDVSKNTALDWLLCNHNQLTTLDVSKNILLTVLWCENNSLTMLDVSNNTALGYLYCYGNQLTTLDVSKNTALDVLQCYSNLLTTLDVSNNTVLTTLECQLNNFSDESDIVGLNRDNLDQFTFHPQRSSAFDDASGWALSELEQAMELGLLLEPMFGNWEQPTNRERAAQAIAQLIEVSTGRRFWIFAIEKGYDMSDTFADTDSIYVTFLKAAGVTTGIGDNNYDPSGTFTRAQMITMLGRVAMNVFDMDLSDYPMGTDYFTDVPDWEGANEAIGWAAELGITEGIGDGLFDSDGILQNQHTGVFAYRAFSYAFGN